MDPEVKGLLNMLEANCNLNNVYQKKCIMSSEVKNIWTSGKNYWI